MGTSREPSEDSINEFNIIASLSRGQAIQWLKAHNNDLNNAVNAYFENPGATPEMQNQVTWDEDHFHTDKTDNVQQAQNCENPHAYKWHSTMGSDAAGARDDRLTQLSPSALTIHPLDTLKPNIFADGAPSRPPSRVSLRGNDLPDLRNQNMTGECEEEQMKIAIAISKGENPDLAPQETGVLDHQSKNFGPATRNHYEPAEWALTFAGAQTQEILLNPQPNDRRRRRNAPAFIKPSPSGHRLPALITILHAIPMAREALLNRGCTLPDYGVNKEWWDGNEIKVLRIVNLDSDGRRTNGDDIIYECQRLMAFLDETDRAYGNTDVLASLGGLDRYESDKVAQLLAKWQGATSLSATEAPLAMTFESRGMKMNTTNPEAAQMEPFWYLVLRVESELSSKGLTLYELLDSALWDDNNDDEVGYLEQVGDVITMEVNNHTANVAGLGIDVPAIWYLDRYLPSAIEQAKEMRTRKAEVNAELQSKEAARPRMTQAKKPSGDAEIDATQLLAKASAYFEQTIAYKEASGEQSGINGISQAHEQGLASSAKVAEELKALTERVTNKLEVFEKVREEAREKLKEISQLYTKPSEDPKEPPHQKYTLRGVSTNPHTTYVLESTKPDDGDDMLSTDAKDWQWWKIEYVSSDAKPIVYTEITEDDVLKAASTESRSTLLIYASERAVAHESGDLPSQLRNFVRTDNLNFSAELEGSSPTKPATPTKRKADDGDDSDKETQFHRSPPYDRSIDNAISNDDLDPNPPSYYSSPSPPALPSRRPVPRKVGTAGSYDDTIPTSLRATGPTINLTSMALDSDEKSDPGQEMQERGGHQSLLPRRKDGKGGYMLGSYVPEIDMEDDEEDEDQRGSRQGDH